MAAEENTNVYRRSSIKIGKLLFRISGLSGQCLDGHKTASEIGSLEKRVVRASQLLLWVCQEELGKTTRRLLTAKRISLSEAKQAYNQVLSNIFAMPPGIHAIFSNKFVDLNDPHTVQQLPPVVVNVHGILTHLVNLSDSVQYRRENTVRYLFENETLRHATLEIIGILNDNKLAEKLQMIQSKRLFRNKTLADYGREIGNLTRQLENTIGQQRRTDIATDEPELEELIPRLAGQRQVNWMRIIRGALRPGRGDPIVCGS